MKAAATDQQQQQGKTQQEARETQAARAASGESARPTRTRVFLEVAVILAASPCAALIIHGHFKCAATGPLLLLCRKIKPKGPRLPGAGGREEREVLGRLELELLDDEVPRTAANFRTLCEGRERGLCYRNNIFHRIIPGFMAQAGDITQQDGSGGMSIYGETFDDEVNPEERLAVLPTKGQYEMGDLGWEGGGWGADG